MTISRTQSDCACQSSGSDTMFPWCQNEGDTTQSTISVDFVQLYLMTGLTFTVIGGDSLASFPVKIDASTNGHDWTEIDSSQVRNTDKSKLLLPICHNK